MARLKTRLDQTFSRVNQLGFDLEARSDFARYLCVLVSGYFENVVVEMLNDYVARSASPQAQRYIASELEWFTNAKREKVLQLFGAFDPTWRALLESVIVDERDAALNSVVALRNKIAHGESVTVTFVQISRYYERVQKIVDAIVDLLDPPA